MAKKVGIFSGTFDPVHNGHVEFALQSAQKFGLDKVFFMVEPKPRRKQGVRAFEHRTNMVRLAIEDHDNLGEIILQQQQFTPHETLPILQARFKGAELYMLVGEDMLLHLGEWPHVDKLIGGLSFIIGTRKNAADIKERIKAIEKTRGLSFRYETIKTQNSDISSSGIRSRIKRHQKVDGLNPEVSAYIRIHGLYHTST